MPESMPFAVHPGPLVFLLHFLAGISAASAVVGFRVDFNNFGLRGQKWLAALCVSVAVYLVAIATHHTAVTLSTAMSAQKWIDVAALLNLFFLCGFVARQTPRNKAVEPMIWAVAGIAVLTIGLTCTLPYGARFESITATDLMAFPWGERLLIMRGTPTPAAGVIKLLLIVPFAWMLLRLGTLYRTGERLPGPRSWAPGSW
jgi:hypothetical protein